MTSWQDKSMQESCHYSCQIVASTFKGFVVFKARIGKILVARIRHYSCQIMASTCTCKIMVC